jgi:hypothetical protein
MKKASIAKIVDNHISSLEGSQFQDFCDRLLLKLNPKDYTPVRAGGKYGDMKNDGYCFFSRVFFAAHATRGEAISKIKEKIKSDLEGCLEKQRDVRRFVYLTNDVQVGEVEHFVDELRKVHPEIVIETWSPKKIASKIMNFCVEDIGYIIDIPLSDEKIGDIENKTYLDLTISKDPQILNKVLFCIYNTECENYYIERSHDLSLKKFLDLCSVWISGPDGCGKTCLVERNLIQANKKFIYIDLGSCSIDESMDIKHNIGAIFNHIHKELFVKLEDGGNDFREKLSTLATQDDILALLKKHFDRKEIYILFEEIPIDETDIFKEFTKKIASLLISLSRGNSNIKFILSSINGPQKYINPSRRNVFEQIKFMNQKYWSREETEQLLNMIANQLSIVFSEEKTLKVIEASQGSPRFIKQFIRNYTSCCGYPGWTFDDMIQETLSDVWL